MCRCSYLLFNHCCNDLQVECCLISVVQESFWHLDWDQDGSLGMSDVQHAVAKAGSPVSDNIEVGTMFNNADVNQTGPLDFTKYTAIMIEKHHIIR